MGLIFPMVIFINITHIGLLLQGSSGCKKKMSNGDYFFRLTTIIFPFLKYLATHIKSLSIGFQIPLNPFQIPLKIINIFAINNL